MEISGPAVLSTKALSLRLLTVTINEQLLLYVLKYTFPYLNNII